MLGKNRVFETTNSIMNWAFSFLAAFTLMYLSTVLIIMRYDLYGFFLRVVNVLAWIEICVFAVLTVLAFSIWITDYRFPVGIYIWAVIRTVLSLVLMILSNIVDVISESGTVISI